MINDIESDAPSKELLEKEKLSAEIKQLTRPWWRKLSTYGTLLPIVITALAVIQGIRSGYFDREKQILEIRERQLKIAIHDLEVQEDSLKALIKMAESISKNTQLTVDDLERSQTTAFVQKYGEIFRDPLRKEIGLIDVYSNKFDTSTQYLVIPAWVVDTFMNEYNKTQTKKMKGGISAPSPSPQIKFPPP